MKETSNPSLAAAQSSSIRGDIKANVAHHVELAKAAAKPGANFIVFSELSLTGYEPELARGFAAKATDPRMKPLRRISLERGIGVVADAPMLTDIGLHIAAFVYRPPGEPLVYTKHHLHKGERL